MVSMTEGAASELKKILEKENKTECGLRIFIAGDSCMGPEYGIGLEETAQESDKVFESHGIKIFIDGNLAKDLDGSTIEYKDTPQGASFLINNPNAPPSCCGNDSTCN